MHVKVALVCLVAATLGRPTNVRASGRASTSRVGWAGLGRWTVAGRRQIDKDAADSEDGRKPGEIENGKYFSYRHVDALLNEGKGSHFGGFPSYTESNAVLSSLRRWNPLFVHQILVGVSYQCRPMWSYLITAEGALDKPRFEERKEKLIAALLEDIWEEENGWLESRCEQQTAYPQTPAANLQAVGNSNNRVNTSDTSLDASPRQLVTWIRNELRLYRTKMGHMKGSRAGETMAALTVSSGKILITSLHHAREPVSLTAPLSAFSIIAHALSNWYSGGEKVMTKKDSTILHSHILPTLMLQREVLFVPFVNPDGYVAIELTNNTDIRKNQRPTCLNSSLEGMLPVPGFHEAELNGVDLNRNYDSSWVQDHSRCDKEEYEGTHPFSESETRSIRRIAKLWTPQIALNFHAYGDFWTRPWNCCPQKSLNHTQRLVFEEMQSVLNVSEFGSAPELPTLGYTANGEADDYLMESFGIISLSPEVGPENGKFYPPISVVQQTNSATSEQIFKVLSKAGPELSAGLWGASCLRGDVTRSVEKRQAQGETTDGGELDQVSETDSREFLLSLSNSGLADTGPLEITLTLYCENKEGLTSSKSRDLFVPGHLDLYESPSHEDTSCSLPTDIRLQVEARKMESPGDAEDDKTADANRDEGESVSEIGDGVVNGRSISFNLPEGVKRRDQSLIRVGGLHTLPVGLEICVSAWQPRSVDRKRYDLNPTIAQGTPRHTAMQEFVPHVAHTPCVGFVYTIGMRAAQVVCGIIWREQLSNACPYGTTALHYRPVLSEAHPALQSLP